MYANMKRGEDTEQIGVIEWAQWHTQQYPELKLLHHIPNGGKRNAAEAARFKAMGVKAGVPDLFLPVPRGGYAGFYIEMKYGKNKQTDKQIVWMHALRQQGYKVTVCYSGAEATHELESYLRKPRTMQIDSVHCKPVQQNQNQNPKTEEKEYGNLIDGYQGSTRSGRYNNF